MRRVGKTDRDGELFINGKWFNYSVVSLTANKISFLILKNILSDIEHEIKKLDYECPNMFWNSKKSPNGSDITEELRWWKISGKFESRIHEDIANMNNFSELTILLPNGNSFLPNGNSSFCEVDISDIRNAKLDFILTTE